MRNTTATTRKSKVRERNQRAEGAALAAVIGGACALWLAGPSAPDAEASPSLREPTAETVSIARFEGGAMTALNVHIRIVPVVAVGAVADATVEQPTAGELVVEAARSQIGVQYRYAASTPGVAFDCSGLTMWAWAQVGVELPHKASRQYRTFEHVDFADLQPGDLVFSPSLGHVGIYTGDLTVVHSPRTGERVKEVPLSEYWTLAARPAVPTSDAA